MKKVLSVFLSVVMLLGALSVGSVAASDTCIKLSDTSGNTGYSAGSDDVNSWVKENEGLTLIFDVMLESIAVPAEGMTSRLIVFTGDSPYNYAGFDFTNGKFTAGAGTSWTTDSHEATYTPYSERSFDWKAGHWYEIAFQYDGAEVTVYLDGMPMVSAEVEDYFETDYVIMYPQYCSLLIDNLRVCGKDYNVRDRYGDIYTATGFNGVTDVGAVSCWHFGSEGYSVSSDGRAMPELEQMLPERTVSPSIDGAYLKYAEAGGNGSATSVMNFKNYNGFTYVEDIRTDRKSTAASFGVRFGNFIAGYDWDNACFRISVKSGFGFSPSSANTFAKTDYSLSMQTVYEFAVRLDGNVCSVYLNGVLMASAQNDDFTNDFTRIDVSHYRMTASVDNVVLAYPDYDVKEAKGSAAARFTFDENRSYIDGIIDYNLDSFSTGYSISKSDGAAAVILEDAVTSDGTAGVGVSLENFTGFTAFELQISYPSDLSVAKTEILSPLNGTVAVSPSSNNPLVISYVEPYGETLPDGKIANIVFNTPEEYGDYTITATIIPYINDILGNPITARCTVTVAKPGVPVGLPDGLAYDGEYITWNEADGAEIYDIYMLYEGDDFEYAIDVSYSTEYYFPADLWFTDAGVYYFRIYMYDSKYEVASVSEDLIVILEEDGAIYSGLDSYADVYYGKLTEFAEGPYSSVNQNTVNTLLAEARSSLDEVKDVASVLDIYESYAQKISNVPVSIGIKGDVSGDGIVSSADFSILSRIISGANLIPGGDPDVDGNGVVNTTDLARLKIMLS